MAIGLLKYVHLRMVAGVTWPGEWFWQLNPSSTEGNSELSYTSAHPYIYMAWTRITLPLRFHLAICNFSHVFKFDFTVLSKLYINSLWLWWLSSVVKFVLYYKLNQDEGKVTKLIHNYLFSTGLGAMYGALNTSMHWRARCTL